MMKRYRGLIFSLLVVASLIYIGRHKPQSAITQNATQNTSQDNSSDTQIMDVDAQENDSDDDKKADVKNKPTSSIKSSDYVLKSEMDGLVKGYIYDHPEVILEAMENMQKKKAEAMKLESEKAVREHKNEISDEKYVAVLGAKNSKNIVNVFIDYNCGYSKQAVTMLNALLEKHKDVKVLIHMLPIFGEDSAKLARIALAAFDIGGEEAFMKIHNAFASSKKVQTSDIAGMLSANKLDAKAIEEKSNTDEIKQKLEVTRKIADAITIQGVPGFVIGDELYPGLIGVNDIEGVLNLQVSDADAMAAAAAIQK